MPDDSDAGPSHARGIFERYFGRGDSANIDEAGRELLNPNVTPADYDSNGEKYRAAILEQYKIYVEMADRISARRSLTNTFFLTLNTAIFAVIGVFWKDRPVGSALLLMFPAVTLIGQCLAWFWLLRSYRQLNSGKYAVVGALEEYLPVRPYWKAEWVALGEGKRKERYWPLTHLEQWVPVLFAISYLGGFVVAVLI
jgi:hypothetical protein